MAHAFNYIPSTSFSSSAKPRKRTVNFGGGYSQRVPESFNVLDKKWSLQFQNRDLVQSQAILDFFEEHQGTEFFYFTPIGESQYYKVICEEWSEVYTSHITRTISCEFIRVFE